MTQKIAVVGLLAIMLGGGGSQSATELSGELSGSKSTSADTTSSFTTSRDGRPSIAVGPRSSNAQRSSSLATSSAPTPLVSGRAGPAMAVGGKTQAASSTVDTGGYRIGPSDTIEVTVFKVPELSKLATVSDTGNISYPLVGDVRVGGLTAAEAETVLATQLGKKYLQDPQVTVLVKEFNSRRFTVEGTVKKPGVFAMREKTTLMQAIAMGGGLDELSDEQATVARDENGKRKAQTYDLAQIRTGAVDDPEVKAGDVVVVGRSMTKEAFNNLAKVAPIARIFVPY